MLFQSELCMIASISPVTYVCPALTRAGGCSETWWLGTIHDSAGSLPAFAAEKNRFRDCTLDRWPSWATSVNDGSGFQIPGVVDDWCIALQVMFALISQSGSVPVKT